MTDLQQAWIDFCEELKGAVDYVFADDQVTRTEIDEAEGVRHVLRSVLKSSLAVVENADPLHPELGWFHPSKMGLDNPDAFYQSAPLDLQYTYVLSGNVGTVAYLGFALMSMDWGTGTIERLASINVRELGADADGNFSITLSPDPDPGTTGHPWFELPAKRTSLLVRQFLSDWEHEHVAQMTISCLDASEPVRTDPEWMVAKLGQVAAEVRRVPPHWNGYYRQHLERGEVNSFDHIVPVDPAEVGALGGDVDQAYAECWYDVAEHEALVVEVEIPDCVYWNVQLGDIWGQSTDWVNRQSSLTGAQARLDDGVLRAVLSHRDPGYANWLDLAGATHGLLLFRWNQAEHAPVPVCTLVALNELDAHMPASELTLSPAERSESLSRRRSAALRRFLR